MITLRDYQREAVDAVFAYFNRAKGNPLVVLPTGSGKTVVLAEVIRQARERHPDTRALVLCHRKELVEQDAKACRALMPDTPIGVYSASLGLKQVRDVTVAQYQSARMDPAAFGKADLVFVDECHLLPHADDGTYRALLAALPPHALVGLTATPYRLDGGRLTRGAEKLFSSICYDLPVRRLIDAGHLVPIVTPPVSLGVDTAKVKTRGGDFVLGELDDPAMKITRAALDEAKVLAKDRRSWLVFCVSVEHAKMARDCLADLAFGTVAIVTGETPSGERDSIIKRFRAGEIRAICNVDVLTTGFDAPIVDCLVMLRPTQSTGLYIQMAGRGMRLHPGKADCLLLDYGGNVERHGPITDPNVRSTGAGAKVEKREGWICKKCDAENGMMRTECGECGAPRPENPRPVEHDTTATRASAMDAPPPAWFQVDDVRYWRHEKADKPPSVGVAYHRGSLGKAVAREWVCPEHGGVAKQKFLTWWAKRGGDQPAPRTVDETIDRAPRELRRVLEIMVKPDGKYERIAEVKLGEKPPPREPGSDDDKDDDGPPVEAGGGWVDDDPLPF